MAFKVGDIVEIRTSSEEWRAWFKDKGISMSPGFPITAETHSKRMPAPLTIEKIVDSYLYVRDKNNKLTELHWDWFKKYGEEEVKEEAHSSEYKKDMYGFSTHPDNWKPGALGIL